MVKLELVASNDSVHPADQDEQWSRFLFEEGLEVLAAYRAIQDPSVRKMHIRLMREAAKAERQSKPGLN